MKIENFKTDKEALLAMTSCLIGYMERKTDGHPFNLALSGGETAKKMFTFWVEEYKEKIDWDNIRFFWVDERCVPPTDPDSNYGHANELLFKPLHIPEDHVHRIHGEVEPGTEAMRYSRIVKEYLPRHGQLPYFDCIILGIGGDAHTASIFPDTLPLLTDSRNYAVSQHPGTSQFRITMTGPLILNDSPLLVPVLGAGKQEMLEELKKGYSPTNPTPAAYILTHAVEAVVYTTTV
ncbi:6-phosphogluconolactonase [Parabacteroides sp. AF17-28]|uniref:6-phosphogluconolactonase n=1 Tax=Parabacteroides sp. AF17-28 TaxID=2292241 RepID=UPI000F008E3A|nr:6-phosphogluconolactonase [Parabacteroides sp. AF17-28]RHR61265.1 6-phosphogluconolactonase [Parabacteroides sp. AF17-28]